MKQSQELHPEISNTITLTQVFIRLYGNDFVQAMKALAHVDMDIAHGLLEELEAAHKRRLTILIVELGKDGVPIKLACKFRDWVDSAIGAIYVKARIQLEQHNAVAD